MAVRPTVEWRALAATHEVTARLFPADLLARYDTIFDAFEADVRALPGLPADDEVIAVVRGVVAALNTLDDDHTQASIATAERDQLCDYIEQTIADSTVDLESFCARQARPRHELTDPWRTW